MSLIAEAAIASFLSPDGDEQREATLAKRLDQQDRRLARLERDVGIAVETLALFIRFWLTTTTPLPDPAAKAARAQSGARYDNFVVALGRRLNKGPRLRQEIPEDVDGKASSIRGLETEFRGSLFWLMLGHQPFSPQRIINDVGCRRETRGFPRFA